MDYSKQEFEHLFKDNYPHMYRMAFSLVENADDAKDAVNQVFTHVANDDDGLEVGTVPVVEEVDDTLALEVHDDLFLADGVQKELGWEPSLPSKFLLKLRAVDSITEVVTSTVGT